MNKLILILASVALMICCVGVPQETTTTTLKTASTQAAPSTSLKASETSITAASSSSSTSTPSSLATTTTQPAAYVNLSPADFKNLVDDNSTFVIDVHIPEQRHINGTDAVIPYNEIEQNLDKLPKDKNTVIAVYCRTGPMGEIAAADLISLGYLHVYNLEGGATAWQDAGLPMQ